MFRQMNVRRILITALRIYQPTLTHHTYNNNQKKTRTFFRLNTLAVNFETLRMFFICTTQRTIFYISFWQLLFSQWNLWKNKRIFHRNIQIYFQKKFRLFSKGFHDFFQRNIQISSKKIVPIPIVLNKIHRHRLHIYRKYLT